MAADLLRSFMKKRRNYKELLLSLCFQYGAKIQEYQYFEKLFGDFRVVIEYKGMIYTITTDKGDIYLGTRLICNSSYHKAGNDDTFDMLICVIKRSIFND